MPLHTFLFAVAALAQVPAAADSPPSPPPDRFTVESPSPADSPTPAQSPAGSPATVVADVPQSSEAPLSAGGAPPPVATTDEPVPLQPEEITLLADRWVESLMGHDHDPGQSTLLPLRELLRQTANAANQRDAIDVYWRAATAMAEIAVAADEARFLQGLSAEYEFERSLIVAARADAAARQAAARLKALDLQYRLAEFLPAAASPPTPIDVPFVGPYRTEIGAFFSGKAAPAPLARIDRSLPLVRDAIERLAEAMTANARAQQLAADAYRQGQVSLTSVLSTTEQLRRQQLDFLASVLRYNEMIAEYSTSVVGSRVSHEQLLSTLIRIESVGPGGTDRSVVVPASAETPIKPKRPVP